MLSYVVDLTLTISLTMIRCQIDAKKCIYHALPGIIKPCLVSENWLLMANIWIQVHQVRPQVGCENYVRIIHLLY